MNISNSFPINFQSIEAIEAMVEKRIVIKNAKDEVYKRLSLRFPMRQILEEDVRYCGIKNVNFNDGSFECPQKGYIVEFKYFDEAYHLHTIKGNSFVSTNLEFNNQYEEKVFLMLIAKLSMEINRTVTNEDIIIENFTKKLGRKLALDECEGDFYLYIQQAIEIHYIFDIIFEGIFFSFCFTENGESRFAENL